MAIGERIRFFRKRCNLTQKQLGRLIGFSEQTADVRLAQYESGERTPKAALIVKIALVLDVSSQAISVPDIDSHTGLIHTLFTLEDRCGLYVKKTNDGICLKVNTCKSREAEALYQTLCVWQEQAHRLHIGETTKKQYDDWRYHYADDDA